MFEDPFDGLTGSLRARNDGTHEPFARALRRRAKRGVTEGHEHMFLEDLTHHALPYRSGPGGGFLVNPTSQDDTVATLIEHGLSAIGYRHGMLEDSFRDYIERAVWHLARGNLYLELEYFRRGDDSGSPVAFQVHLLDPELVAKRFGRYRYRALRTDSSGRTHRVDEPIDPHALVVVSLSTTLRRDLDRALAASRASGNDVAVMTDFTVGRHGENSGFDLNEYKRSTNDIFLRNTRATGWTARSIWADGMLDPQKAWRAIRFERLVITLRDTALRGLNQALHRAGLEVGFTAALELSRVLTPLDLDAMEADLRTGVRPMSDLLYPGLTDKTA